LCGGWSLGGVFCGVEKRARGNDKRRAKKKIKGRAKKKKKRTGTSPMWVHRRTLPLRESSGWSAQ